MQSVHLRCSEVCKCGYPRLLHAPETSYDEKPGEWTVYTHTKTEPTDAFGEMCYAGSTKAAKVI